MALTQEHVVELLNFMLRHGVLSGANLERADMHGANLSRATLFQANLSKADLNHATLFQANLSKANVNHATLLQPNPSEADLSTAEVTDEQLAQAASLTGAILPDDTNHTGEPEPERAYVKTEPEDAKGKLVQPGDLDVGDNDDEVAKLTTAPIFGPCENCPAAYPSNYRPGTIPAYCLPRVRTGSGWNSPARSSKLRRCWATSLTIVQPEPESF